MTADLTRRSFLKVSAAAGGGLLIGISLHGCTGGSDTPPATGSEAVTGSSTEHLAPDVYVRVDGDGTVTVTAFRSEMGQGVRTAFAMIVAEELDADWSSVRVEQAPADPSYGQQRTGGSTSISDSFQVLREAGAIARNMLVRAAAGRWNVDPTACTTEAGWVTHPDGERRLPYGELAGAAAELDVPMSATVPLKDPSRFRLIGSRVRVVDAPDIVAGRAVYTSDVTVSGMAYAVIARPPTAKAGLQGYDADAATRVPGVRDVVEVAAGVAVVADHTWAAIAGREALAVEWDTAAGGASSQAVLEGLMGDVGASGAGYAIPYLAHAPMEPMCCVAASGPTDATCGRQRRTPTRRRSSRRRSPACLQTGSPCTSR